MRPAGSPSPALLVLGAAGVVTLAGTAGRLHAGGPAGVGHQGEISFAADHLTLEAGALLELGRGRSVLVEAESADVDLMLGDPAGRHVVGHFGAVAGLYRHDLSLMGNELPTAWQGGSHYLGLVCGDMLEITADRRRLQAGPPEGCVADRMWIRAGQHTVLRGAAVDGVAVVFARESVVWPHAGAGLGLGLATALVFGLAGAMPLLLSPLALLGPSVGVKALTLLGVVLATTGASAAVDPSHARWRKLFGGVWALGGVGLALAAVLDFARPTNMGASALNTERPLFVAVDPAMVNRKVEQAISNFKAQKLPEHHPRVVALGSSSSGGGTSGRFWPQILQEKLPNAQVVSLALGGSTSWHMRRILETLDLRPELCILYMGHNDQVPSFPGIGIAGLMRGDSPDPDHWVPPVTLAEAADNVNAMASRCGAFVGVSEYAKGREPAVLAYAEMLASVPGIRVLDAASMFRGLPASAMLDDVHPSPAGQERLALLMLPTVQALLSP